MATASQTPSSISVRAVAASGIRWLAMTGTFTRSRMPRERYPKAPLGTEVTIWGTRASCQPTLMQRASTPTFVKATA